MGSLTGVSGLSGMSGLFGGAVVVPASWYTAGVVPIGNVKRAYAPKGAADLASSYVDLVAIQDAAPGSAPNWDATNGWKFNGSSHYLTTGLVATATTSVLLRLSNYTGGATTGNSLFGAYQSGTKQFWVGPNFDGTTHVYHIGNVDNFSAPPLNTGVVICTPTGLWIDGVRKSTITPVWSAMTHGLYIGAFNNTGSAQRFGPYYCQLFSAYDIDLNTSTYIADLTAAAAAV